MFDPMLEAARQQIDERVARAARDRRCAAVRRPRARHTLATQLRRFADRLDS